jgi:hypothetical protein
VQRVRVDSSSLSSTITKPMLYLHPLLARIPTTNRLLSIANGNRAQAGDLVSERVKSETTGEQCNAIARAPFFPYL